jgi:hypothetical protein
MAKPVSSSQGWTPIPTQLTDRFFQDTLSGYLAKYKSRLTKDEEKELGNTKLIDVQRQILQIQDQQGKEKNIINLTRIDRFLKAMDEWEAVVSIFADSSVFVAFIWGLVKALLQVSRFYDIFLQSRPTSPRRRDLPTHLRTERCLEQTHIACALSRLLVLSTHKITMKSAQVLSPNLSNPCSTHMSRSDGAFLL